MHTNTIFQIPVLNQEGLGQLYVAYLSDGDSILPGFKLKRSLPRSVKWRHNKTLF